MLKLMGNIFHLHVDLWTFFLLLFIVEIAVSYPHTEEFTLPENPYITFTYDRFPEIERHCGFLISSASELPPDDNRGERMKKELFFMNGDWDQESSGAPLLPFDSREMPSDNFRYGPPLKLVSFWLMNVDPIRRAKNTVSISGVMEIGIFRTESFSHKPYEWSSKFYTQPETTKLTILFEGIYLESEENGGQRLMCFLGNATIPSTSSQETNSSCDPGDPCQHQVNKPSTLQDDQIMLVLQYPKTFTLTSRGITGELKSLNSRGNLAYFDKIHISSQLGQKSKYRFESEGLLSKACSPYPYPESLMNEDVEVFKGDNYCEKLRKFVWSEVFEFSATKKNVVNSKLGPFSLDREIEATYYSSDKLRLIIQELQCEPGTDQIGDKIANVSAVLRLIQKSQYLQREEMRTGLSTMTLSAEGSWSSADGQLCMVGCLGPPDALSDRCNSRITLYFPLTFSIKQHNSVLGTITSIKGSELYAPLVFQRLTTPNGIRNTNQWSRDLKWSYSYSKIMQAKEFQKRSKPSNLGRKLRQLLFWYPSSKGVDIASFSFFADVLSVEVFATPQTSTDSQAPKTYVEMVLLSMGSLFGRYEPPSYLNKLKIQEVFHSPSEEIQISGHLKIKGGHEIYNISLFFEGIYDPTVGKMYLIGCRDVQEFQEFNNDDRNLEGGLDCLIEIKVEYSPKNARWLLNPNIKFSISSKRSKEDPLYLHPVSTGSFLLSYTKKFAFVMVRKGFEEGLRILLLVMAILCIRGQFRDIENQGHPTAYISLVMLGLQTLGFSIPLITGDEVLLRWKEFSPYKNSAYQFEKFQVFQALDFLTKFLLMFALLEISKLLHRVWESRKMLNAKQLNIRIPNDKLVFLFFLLIHIVGFVTLHTFRKINGIPLLFQSENNTDASVNIKRLLKLWGEMESYGMLIQDFFLLPQIIGNALWGVQGKPLRKIYYMGFTIIRLVIQAYDYARDPVPNPNYSELEYQYLGVESYYKLGNIVLGFIVVTLAVMVHVQQNYACLKIGQIRKTEECDNSDSKPDKMYQRLLTE